MTLECNAKFEGKLTCGLENDMRNLTLKNLKKFALSWADFDQNICFS